MVNAVSRRPIDSATISVLRSGGDDHPVGKVEVLGDDGGAVVGVEADDHAALASLRSDVGAPASSTTMSPRLAGARSARSAMVTTVSPS